MLEQNCAHKGQEAEEEMSRVKACPSDLTLDLPLVPISSVSYQSHSGVSPSTHKAIQTLEVKRGVRGGRSSEEGSEAALPPYPSQA